MFLIIFMETSIKISNSFIPFPFEKEFLFAHIFNIFYDSDILFNLQLISFKFHSPNSFTANFKKNFNIFFFTLNKQNGKKRTQYNNS